MYQSLINEKKIKFYKIRNITLSIICYIFKLQQDEFSVQNCNARMKSSPQNDM